MSSGSFDHFCHLGCFGHFSAISAIIRVNNYRLILGYLINHGYEFPCKSICNPWFSFRPGFDLGAIFGPLYFLTGKHCCFRYARRFQLVKKMSYLKLRFILLFHDFPPYFQVCLQKKQMEFLKCLMLKPKKVTSSTNLGNMSSPRIWWLALQSSKCHTHRQLLQVRMFKLRYLFT